VPEPVGVAWHNRKALNLSFNLGRKMQKMDPCDENLKSFAHMAEAGMVGCSFCLDFGYFHAHNEGLGVTTAHAEEQALCCDLAVDGDRPTQSA
jgi:hypothetical protein